MSLLRGLALSCHPLPTVAVTAMATALVIAADNSPRVCVIAAVAVFAGQLTIGWSNDLVDVERDVVAGRSDKPLATGQLSRQVVTRALASALVVTLIASLLLGWRAAAAQLTVVASGLTYNLGVKSTMWSVVPYAIAFGTLPAVATLALPEPVWPAWWATISGALIGVAAHFGNVLPDLAEDRQTGVRGLPHRLGSTFSAVAATALSSGAAGLSFVAVAHPASPLQWVLLAGAGGSLLWALLVLRRNPRSEAVFVATMVIAAVAIALLVTG
ncbi:MAG: UbiA family prenyltransferase [Nocardioidaceae bacterium]|nr:UbiA family prenyltransferase [Nocardioidaceae bacterium]